MDKEKNCQLDREWNFIFNHYLKTLDEDITANSLNDESYIGNFLILSELMPFLTDKPRWHNNISRLTDTMNRKLANYVSTMNMGFLQGLTGVIYSLRQLSLVYPDIRSLFLRRSFSRFSYGGALEPV